MKRVLPFSLIVVTLGCGPPAPPAPRLGVDGKPGFDVHGYPYNYADGSTLARVAPAVPAGWYGDAGSLDVAADGTLHVVRSAMVDGGKRLVAERYSPDGDLEAREPVPFNCAPERLLPGGELLLRHTLPDQHAEYVRWSADLHELLRVALPDRGEVALPDHYTVTKNGSFTVEPGGGGVVDGWPSSLVSDGGSGYYAVEPLRSATHGQAGTRVVHLDASFAVTAAAWIFPGVELAGRRRDEQGAQEARGDELATPRLLVDSRHRLWALTSLPAAAAPALAHFHGGRAVDVRDGGDLVLLRFDGGLTLDALVALPAANEQRFGQLVEGADGTIGVTALSIAPAAQGATSGEGYNIAFAAVDADAHIVGQRELDLADDDWPRALAPCGRQFCIGGETGSAWDDRGSQVAFARGFIVALDADGTHDRQWTLRGPRHNVVSSLAATADGGVAFSAMTNGPITDTDLSERQATPVLGIARF